jgi:transposase
VWPEQARGASSNGAAARERREPVLSLVRAHEQAAALLDAGIFAAVTSGLEPFVRVAITIDRHAKSIRDAVILGVNNARLEAMNSTVRLLSHRAWGFRRLESPLSLVTLACGRVPVNLPT